MKKERGKGNIAGLSALLVFGVFAVCILLVLLTGANAYRRLTQRDQSAYSQRTAVQYLSARVRQADRQGGITVDTFGGEDTLLCYEELDGVWFVTRVYYYDGTIRELFSFADESFEPGDGEVLFPACGLELSLHDSVLSAVVTHEDGTQTELQLLVRSGGEVVP